jgi:hypothetical protein
VPERDHPLLFERLKGGQHALAPGAEHFERLLLVLKRLRTRSDMPGLLISRSAKAASLPDNRAEGVRSRSGTGGAVPGWHDLAPECPSRPTPFRSAGRPPVTSGEIMASRSEMRRACHPDLVLRRSCRPDCRLWLTMPGAALSSAGTSSDPQTAQDRQGSLHQFLSPLRSECRPADNINRAVADCRYGYRFPTA